MRYVIHFAVNADGADIRLGCEGRNDAARMREIGLRWREAFIDRGDLIGMNRDASDKPVAARNPATLGQSGLIPIITVQGLERENTRRVGGEKGLCGP